MFNRGRVFVSQPSVWTWHMQAGARSQPPFPVPGCKRARRYREETPEMEEWSTWCTFRMQICDVRRGLSDAGCFSSSFRIRFRFRFSLSNIQRSGFMKKKRDIGAMGGSGSGGGFGGMWNQIFESERQVVIVLWRWCTKQGDSVLSVKLKTLS